MRPAGTNFQPFRSHRNLAYHSDAYSDSTAAIPRATLSIICSGSVSIGFETCSFKHSTDEPLRKSTTTLPEPSSILRTTPISLCPVLTSTHTITRSPAERVRFRISFSAYRSRKIFWPSSLSSLLWLASRVLRMSTLGSTGEIVSSIPGSPLDFPALISPKDRVDMRFSSLGHYPYHPLFMISTTSVVPAFCQKIGAGLFGGN